MLIPLGQRSADDLAALMITAAEMWSEEHSDRATLERMFTERYDITITESAEDYPVSNSWLPYRFFLESALSSRIGQPLQLHQHTTLTQGQWFWVDLPLGKEPVRVGFPRSRIGVHPPAALLLVLTVGISVTLFTVIILVKRLTSPLESLAKATRSLGAGDWPDPVSESGPDELAELARSFNRMTRQVRELLANRTTLLAGISHDLRTPITQIQLALEMLPDEGGDSDLMAGIRRDLDQMNRLIGMFLDISRGLEGTQNETILIEPLLDDLIKQFQQRGAIINWTPCSGCCQSVNALALNRIIANLLENAIRYGNGSPVFINCVCTGKAITLIIRDQGPGIPEEELESVFRPFYRLEQSRNRDTGGSGLGLSIVRQLAQAYGWQVHLSNHPQGGIEAVITLQRPLQR